MRPTVTRIARLLGFLWLLLFTLAPSARAADLGVTADFAADGQYDNAQLDRHESSVIRVWARDDGAGVRPVPRHRATSDDPAPNDDPDVTAHTVQALISVRCAGPRAPGPSITGTPDTDPTAPDSGVASSPFAPRPPPAISRL